MAEIRRNKSIAFDVQPLLSGSKSGVGFHEDGLIRCITELYQKNTYIYEYFSWKDKDVKREIINRYVRENTEVKECRWFPGSLYRMAWWICPFPYRIFFGRKAALTHFFNYCVPPGVYGKKVVTIHDMAFHRYAETVHWKTKMMLKINLKKSIQRADAIISVSEFTKKEIQIFYNVSPEKIYVVPNGVDYDRFHQNYSEEIKRKVKEKYGIEKEYFLYFGNIEPRKNLIRLVEAYSKAKEKYGSDFPLLIIGGAKGWLCKEIYKNVENSGYSDSIKFIGYVADEEVPILMGAAEIFCFVPLYEGFGMPAIEAMACGTAVLASNNSAVAEVVGEAAVKVDPTDTEAISSALLELHRNAELRISCEHKGIKRAKVFSWEHATRKLYEVYEKVIG